MNAIEKFVMGCVILVFALALVGAMSLGRVGIRIASDDHYYRSTCVFCLSR